MHGKPDNAQRLVQRHSLAVLVISTLFVLSLGAQSAPEGQGGTLETKARGFWTDPSTGLMWAGKDNGKDVSWKNATRYCSDLRLAEYSNWRLATLEELKGVYDKNATAPGLMGPSGKGTAATWHVKGNLFLTGLQWSSSQRLDDRGHPSGYVWRFDFNEGRDFGGDQAWFHVSMRALCVRGSEK